MNANPITMSPRLKHIRIVSRLFRLAISLGVIFLLLVGGFALVQSIVVCQGGQIVPGESMTVKMTFSPDQVYVIPTSVQGAAEAPDIPWPVLALAAIQLALTACGVIALNRLFKLFERGIFFAVENVRHLKTLGLVVAGCGLVQTLLEWLSPAKNLSLNLLVLGLLIVLISWIMDEGRKLQEEQALTV